MTFTCEGLTVVVVSANAIDQDVSVDTVAEVTARVVCTFCVFATVMNSLAAFVDVIAGINTVTSEADEAIAAEGAEWVGTISIFNAVVTVHFTFVNIDTSGYMINDSISHIAIVTDWAKTHGALTSVVAASVNTEFGFEIAVVVSFATFVKVNTVGPVTSKAVIAFALKWSNSVDAVSIIVTYYISTFTFVVIYAVSVDFVVPGDAGTTKRTNDVIAFF
jgi:hypothetical protein